MVLCTRGASTEEAETGRSPELVSQPVSREISPRSVSQKLRVGGVFFHEMVQLVRALAAKPGDTSSVPEAHMVEE